MKKDPLFEAFENELSRLDRLAKDCGVPAGDSASPSEVLTFAEFLLLCPTEDAAKSQMRRDQKGATGFLAIALELKTVLPKIGTSISSQPPKNRAPFYVAASLLQEFLQKVKAQSPDEWH